MIESNIVVDFCGARHQVTNMALSYIDPFSHILPRLREANGCIAGGLLRDFYAGEEDKIKDIDIFLFDRPSYKHVVALLTGESSARIKQENDGLGEDAITKLILGGKQIDVVLKGGFDCVRLLEAFDFTICQIAIDLKTYSIHHNKDFFMHLAARELHIGYKEQSPGSPYQSVHNPISRMQKFIKRGYTMPIKECERLFNMIHGGKIQVGCFYEPRGILLKRAEEINIQKMLDKK